MSEMKKYEHRWVTNDKGKIVGSQHVLTGEWWECEVCLAPKVNLRSGAGCVCPNGHGGITPGLVTEDRRPTPRNKRLDDISYLIPNSRGCCRHEDTAAIATIGARAYCWDCAAKLGVRLRLSEMPVRSER